jgi:hypothetical protein
MSRIVVAIRKRQADHKVSSNNIWIALAFLGVEHIVLALVMNIFEHLQYEKLSISVQIFSLDIFILLSLLRYK